ncbi:uncharacterized protein LOC117175494 [Belonocnema kinseyi]|uniref:uncharacterized protein LOC117175494 n=1 Tax=Belonocnema kinseyi TaxID=2817044 RepID=UPI00143D2315|nr:uncharacterized protein LOC117175494 [Belonocnema kinseyi]
MAEKQIADLKIKIANAKRKITNFATYLEKFTPERDFPNLEKRNQENDKSFLEFEISQTELETLENDSTYPNIRTEYEEKYYTSHGIAATLLKENLSSTNNSIQSNASLSSLNVIHENSTNIVQGSKKNLPRVNLPSFSGSYESWLGFHDLFKSLVDDNKDIPEIEKLYHLKGCLKNEAAEVLASIELSSDNYKVAWDLLKERYDNRKIIRQTHVKALLNLPFISKDFPVRSLVDQIQKHIRALDALKEPVNQWGTLLVEIIKQKLNSFIREKWEEASCDSDNPTFKEMLTFLQRCAQFEDNKFYEVTGKSQIVSDKKLTEKERKMTENSEYCEQLESLKFC